MKKNNGSRNTESKQKILEATLEIIGIDGLNGVTFRAVAKKAGVPLGLTSYYFKNKEELYIETYGLFYERSVMPVNVLAENAMRVFSEIDPSQTDKEVLVEELVRITTQYIKSQVINGVTYRRVAAAFMHAGIVHPIIKTQVAKRQREFIVLGESFFTMLGISEPEHVSNMFLALTNHVERQLMLESKKRFNKRYVDDTFTHFYRLIFNMVVE